MSDTQIPENSTTVSAELAQKISEKIPVSSRENLDCLQDMQANLLDMRETNVSYLHIKRQYNSLTDELQISLVCFYALAAVSAFKGDLLFLVLSAMCCLLILVRRYMLYLKHLKMLDENSRTFEKLKQKSDTITTEIRKFIGTKS